MFPEAVEMCAKQKAHTHIYIYIYIYTKINIHIHADHENQEKQENSWNSWKSMFGKTFWNQVGFGVEFSGAPFLQ